MPIARYRNLAAYNAWANTRLYAAAARLDTAQYIADRGAFFGSVHRTLNHLLVGDQLWLRRLTGIGPAPASLDTILFETLEELTAARQAEDARIGSYAAGLTVEDIDREVTYANMAGTHITQTLGSVLDHVFNHQTHHRGQVHALLTGLIGQDGAPSLDLVQFQREVGIARVLA